MEYYNYLKSLHLIFAGLFILYASLFYKSDVRQTIPEKEILQSSTK
jgi:hypothetical protein